MRDLYGSRELTPRERRVVALVAEGLKNRDVARALGVSRAAVQNHLRCIYVKLGMYNRVELALWHVARELEAVAVEECCGLPTA